MRIESPLKKVRREGVKWFTYMVPRSCGDSVATGASDRRFASKFGGLVCASYGDYF